MSPQGRQSMFFERSGTMNMKLKRRAGIMTADMKGETVMMDVVSGKYYNLGTVGGRIWELLKNSLSKEELISGLTGEYDVTPEQCGRDIMPFLNRLVSAGLVTCTEE